MSRFRNTGSYGHKIQLVGTDRYRLNWTVDRFYAGDRLRYPRSAGRDTDRAGAERFAKRWGCKVPEPQQ